MENPAGPACGKRARNATQGAWPTLWRPCSNSEDAVHRRVTQAAFCSKMPGWWVGTVGWRRETGMGAGAAEGLAGKTEKKVGSEAGAWAGQLTANPKGLLRAKPEFRRG